MGIAAGLVGVALVLGLIYAPNATIELLGIIPVSVVVAGKFLPLWGVTGASNFSPWQLGVVVWLLDTYTVLVVVYGLEVFYRCRRIERWLHHIQSNARLVLRAYPRIRRAAVIGVVLFVLFPFAGTGAMVGTFLGILLGLERRTVIAAVSAGGLLGGMLMAFAAVNFEAALSGLRTMQQHPVGKYGAIGLVVAALILAFWWVSRAYARALAQARVEEAAESSTGHR